MQLLLQEKLCCLEAKEFQWKQWRWCCFADVSFSLYFIFMLSFKNEYTMWKGKGMRWAQKMSVKVWKKASLWQWEEEDTVLWLAWVLLGLALSCLFFSIPYFSHPLFVNYLSFATSVFPHFFFFFFFFNTYSFLSLSNLEIIWVSNKQDTFWFPKSAWRQQHLLRVKIKTNACAIST